MKTQLLFLNDEFKGGLLWLVLGLFVVSLIAVSPLISSWLWGLLAAIAVWFVLEKRYPVLQRFNHVVMVLSVLGYIAAVLLLDSNWLSAQAITGFLVTIILLKLIEIRKKSEVLWVIAAMMVLIGIGTLYWNSLVGFVLLLLVLFGIVFSMVLLSQVGKLQWKRDFAISAKMFGLAIPLSLVFFFFMPRYDGPLWDLGLAFGVPINLTQSAPPEPLLEGNRLRSDKVSSFMNQANTVLVAEFDGKVPYKSDMYWRGPIFTHFDGLEWYLEDGALKRAELMRGKYRTQKQWAQDVQYQGTPLKYKVRVMPHGERWLYALDTSTAGAPETFLSRDFQLLSIRKIHQEFSYDSTWLKNYRVKPELNDKVWSDSLGFPEGSHPGLKKFGEELAHEYPDAEERILSLYQLFRKSFSKSERTDEVKPDYLDEVWLTHKSGTMLDIASATALVLRASGVPTRLVTGFRGGNIVALTDFVMVKQSHAHIWVEAWLDDKGWVRVEPQDYISVQALKDRPSSVVKASELNQKKEQAKPGSEKKQNANSTPDNVKTGQLDNLNLQSNADSSAIEGAGEEQWWHAFDQWLVQYDADKQEKLIQQVGSESGLSAFKLLLIVLGILLLLTPLYFIVLSLLGRPKTDKVASAYRKLQVRLASEIDIVENECPSEYLQRLRGKDTELSEMVAPVIGQYLNYKYGSEVIDEKALGKQFERVLGLLS